jgi:parallel beta-helix repeat protein
MPKHPTSILALFVSLAILSAAPAIAADGQITITQAKANAGNVTPGDAPGFPVTLSLPGSYILASNLQPPANKAGIRIASGRVTIDFNGFQLNGAGVATTGIFGVDFNSVTIRNGTITGFAAHGIYGEGENWTVKDMRVTENGVHGIYVFAAGASVRNSTVTENGGHGIRCYANCLIEDNTVSGNGDIGVYLGSGTVLGNVIIGNTDFGLRGGNLTGFGNNTLASNNGDGNQTTSYPVAALHPNACDPDCP